EHLPLLDDRDPGRLEGPARGRSVLEQEVGDADAADDPGAAPLDAHARATQHLAHARERAGTVLEGDGQVLHGAGSQRTSVRTELAMKQPSCASRCIVS